MSTFKVSSVEGEKRGNWYLLPSTNSIKNQGCSNFLEVYSFSLISSSIFLVLLVLSISWALSSSDYSSFVTLSSWSTWIWCGLPFPCPLAGGCWNSWPDGLSIFTSTRWAPPLFRTWPGTHRLSVRWSCRTIGWSSSPEAACPFLFPLSSIQPLK